VQSVRELSVSLRGRQGNVECGRRRGIDRAQAHRAAARLLTPAYLSLKNCRYRAVPRPFYYRRVERRESLLTAVGIVLGCGVVLLLLMLFISMHLSY
jgi:hypothetical protein